MLTPGFMSPAPQFAPAFTTQPTTAWLGAPVAQQPVQQQPTYSFLSPYQRQQVSGLTEFERVSLRMWGHDIQDDGRNDGSVILKTLLNAQKSGNDAFLKTPGSYQTVLNHLYYDTHDDGIINGSSIRNVFGNVYWKVTGHDISRQLAAAPLTPANLSLSEIYREQPDMRTPEGLKAISQQTGLSINQFLNTSIWGHDAIDRLGYGGRNLDGSVLVPALTDPSSIDYGFVNSMPSTKQYTQGLILGDIFASGRITGQTLNRDFLSVLNQIYGSRFI